MMRKTLFVASEAHPLMKTGGLGDVCGSLPQALAALGEDVRLLMPGYHDAMQHAGRLKPVAALTLPPLAAPVQLLETRLPGTRVKTWLIDFPPAYDRPGNPYQNAHGHDWHDNAARFALLARVAVALSQGVKRLRWTPDIVHAHDWQAGLVPALLSLEPVRPATVFTIHNLAYQGLFPYDSFVSLGLPPALWSFAGLEFHGQLSFIKGGIAFADRVTTVSPNYAREIQTPEFGHGLDGLLRHRAPLLRGILNGIDTKVWNPQRDPALAARYSAHRLAAGKTANKAALRAELGLADDPGVPLLGMVSRLVPQKGIDLFLEALPVLLEQPLQCVVLGTGETHYEQALRVYAQRHPEQLAVIVGYDEILAHRIIAGADLFLMPSRFEPCGLTQLYSLRYGTVPVVHRVGGLTDSVIDTNAASLADGSATGVAFESANSAALVQAVSRALELYRRRRVWQALRRQGMRQDFSWQHSAAEYQRLYDELVPRSPLSFDNSRSPEEAQRNPGAPAQAPDSGPAGLHPGYKKGRSIT
jgi:starch synthase